MEPLVATEVDDTPRPNRVSAGATGCAASAGCCCGRLPIVLVLGIAVAAVGWYARKDYFVGTSQGQVTVFKGVPGGLAGWDPTIEQRTDGGDRRPEAGRAGPGARPPDLLVARDAAAFVARLRGADHHHDDDHEHDDDGSADHHARRRHRPRSRRPRREDRPPHAGGAAASSGSGSSRSW